MARKILEDKDGLITNTYFDNDKDGVIQKRSQDFKPIIEHNKKHQLLIG